MIVLCLYDVVIELWKLQFWFFSNNDFLDNFLLHLLILLLSLRLVLVHVNSLFRGLILA